MTLSDDLRLVTAEIERCLHLAGENLHEPPAGRGSANALAAAQHWTLRRQHLEALGVEKAAAYLRQEVVDAFAADHEATELLKSTPRVRNTTPSPRSLSYADVVTSVPPADALSYHDLVALYNKIINVGPRWPNGQL